MNILKIHSVEHKGDLDKECVWLDVLADIQDLGHYIISDTTYIDEAHISNELRHIFWFAKQEAKKGDWIKLMTKTGKNVVASNGRHTKTHVIYWNLSKTIWNKAGDTAVLLHVSDWSSKRV